MNTEGDNRIVGSSYESGEIARRIVEYIRDRNLSVGERLPTIRELASTWGVGITIVRDALLQVQTMGLIKVLPRSGAFVQSASFAPLVDALTDTLDTALLKEDANLLQLVEARWLLEASIVAEAAQRHRTEDMYPVRQALVSLKSVKDDRAEFVEADEQFHLSIAKLTGNSVLVTMLRSLLVLLRPYRLTMTPSAGQISVIEHDHEELYSAVLNGDPVRAQAALEKHLQPQRDAILNHIRDLQVDSVSVD